MNDTMYIVLSHDDANHYVEQWHDEDWANERADRLNEEEDGDYYVIEWTKPELTD